MAKYKSFPGNNSSILIEVEEGSTGGGSGNFKDSLGMLQEVIRSFVDSVNKIPAPKKPNELKITFGLKALEDGSMAISADPSHCNFEVKILWSHEPSTDEVSDKNFN
ncbi:TPA: CU044_2847 family protein [Legionella pneumophila]|uniref:Trypsin-co-occurring domain-containing protein n=1 Tax=Legionella pneumophila subsp. pneumophila TaxID=91891 RepID=A0AAV2UW94_LEGPN|nr:CU044_2847 family protein [Legionella pneumophila]MCK1848012.1 hypothetical protein [Legionella pneumophila]MDI9851543.1 CU044_2847 family protein [Legionella pneumophila]MDW8853869.1 CU044_2847 family protein [Legionella pneumophila]MDW8921017.1 CU044_2847 family protein [Legionella pneumophila]MDW8927355.1 CU044_2847 family protein [Legionella pneumophila]